MAVKGIKRSERIEAMTTAEVKAWLASEAEREDRPLGWVVHRELHRLATMAKIAEAIAAASRERADEASET